MTFEEWKATLLLPECNGESYNQGVIDGAEMTWEAAKSKWKPIATAPKDGTSVLLRIIIDSEVKKVMVCFYNKNISYLYPWRSGKSINRGGYRDGYFSEWCEIPE